MFGRVRPYLITLVCCWVALFLAAIAYSQQNPQSHWIITAALPAFSIEAVFYLAAGFEQTREWLSHIKSRRTQAGILWISALLPYILFSLSAGTFQVNAFRLLALLCAVFAFWYAVFPRRWAFDTGFLIIGAAPILLRVFHRIYRPPDGNFPVDILGHLMWIRLGVTVLLVMRQWDPGPFSFWPSWAEWKAGLFYYALVLVPIVALGLGLNDVRFVPLHGEWWRIAALAIGTFFGFLWGVVLGDELFFRGVIERALLNEWRSPVAAVLISAALFGAAHLWFHGFPNWRRALVVAMLGIACGAAYARNGSVRTPMVTHAFVVTTWKVFFR
jgi:membrane protease YdiL (CAAX protease family)